MPVTFQSYLIGIFLKENCSIAGLAIGIVIII